MMVRAQRTAEAVKRRKAPIAQPAASTVHPVSTDESAAFGCISDTLPYPAMVFDRSGKLIYINAELTRLCGVQGAAAACAIADVLPAADAAQLERAWQQRPAGEDNFCVELRFKLQDGSERWHQLRVRALMPRNKQPSWLRKDPHSAYLGVAFDVHDVKERERRVEASGCVRNNFLTVASHELRTPLTSLQLNLQVAFARLTNSQAPKPVGETLFMPLKRSLREIRRLEEVVSDILDASRIRAGKLPLRLSDVGLRQLIEEMANIFERPFAENNCQIRNEVDESIIGSWDRERLSQVFFNLFANVQKHAPGSGIRITARCRDQRVRITIADNGPGIAQCFHKSIFRRFERATEVRGVSGLGLGLYLCRQIVAEHGGHMRVVSEQGRGARFVIVLPREPFCRLPRADAPVAQNDNGCCGARSKPTQA